MNALVALLFAVLFTALLMPTNAGPLTVGACYTACNAGAVSCYGLCGVTFGTQPVGWLNALWGAPACVSACGTVQGACMAACTTTVVAPTP